MATTQVTLNGVVYQVPQPGERGPTYDQDLTDYLIALATAFPQGGSSPSSTFQALVSAGANPADAGRIRLSNTDLIDWRNAGNSGNDSLGASTLDDLTWTNATTARVNTLSGHPVAGAHITTAQTGITTATGIVWNTEDTDTDAAYNPATGIFTVPTGKAGVYFANASLLVTQATNISVVTLDIRVNGGVFAQTRMASVPIATSAVGLTTSVAINCAAGQTIQAFLTSSLASASTVVGTGSFFSVVRLCTV